MTDNKTDHRHELAEIEAFSHLTGKQLAELEAEVDIVTVNGGDVLIREGAPSDSLYLVVSGRFYVTVGKSRDPVAEIGTGNSIGEIGFFSGNRRTATVTAARDSLVLRLKRKDFDALCERFPEIWPKMAAMLAKRLVRITTLDPVYERTQARTIALCHAGSEPLPEKLLAEAQDTFLKNCNCRFLTANDLKAEFPRATLDGNHAVTRWLNDEESKYDYLVFVADETLTDWSKMAIRHADKVLRVGVHSQRGAGPVRPMNALEKFAEKVHDAHAQRLVVYRPDGGEISGTRHWLEGRSVRMHHHLRGGVHEDFERLLRFVRGEAVGLVACGGGAYCAAHTGIFQALIESGVEFDIMGGTSGGAAMVGGYAKGIDPDELDRRTHEIFVTRRAMRRATWPRYSLLDHRHFDDCLAEHYGETLIEDLPIPYFSIATDLSNNQMHCVREGELWMGIRASSAIPGLLPPVFTDEGVVLVDGSLLDNVPIRKMCELKEGPNVVINFEPPQVQISGFAYSDLPSRAELIRKMLFPYLTSPPPNAPGPGSILTRSLAVNRIDHRTFIGERDLLFIPPIPEGMSIMDWRRHSELKKLAYEYACKEIAGHRKAGHHLLTNRPD